MFSSTLSLKLYSECQCVNLCPQVLGDVRVVSVGQVLPELVGPVVTGHSDMTLTQHSTVRHDPHLYTVHTMSTHIHTPSHTRTHTHTHTHTHIHTHTQWRVLGLLSYPLTFSTATGNTSVFCLLKAVWMKGTLFSQGLYLMAI